MHKELRQVSVVGHTLTFTYSDNTQEHITGTLDELRERLPYSFVRINRNLMIDLLLVKSVDYSNKKLFTEQNTYTISRRRLNDVRKRINILQRHKQEMNVPVPLISI